MMMTKSIGMALCSITAALSVLLTGAPEPDSASLVEAESEGSAVSSVQSEICAPAGQGTDEVPSSSLPTEVVMEPELISSEGQFAASDSSPGEAAEEGPVQQPVKRCCRKPRLTNPRRRTQPILSPVQNRRHPHPRLCHWIRRHT